MIVLVATSMFLFGVVTHSLADEFATQAPESDHTEIVRVLAFQRNHDGVSEVGIVDEYGRSMKILAQGSLYHSTRCWSRDGQQIAYSTGSGIVHEINVMRADGSEKKQLTSLGRYSIFCDWSPDQKKLLFKTGKNDGWWSIAEVALEDKKVNVIREKEDGNDCYWSQTGDTIITVSGRVEHEINREGERLWVSRARSPTGMYEITARTKLNRESYAYLSSTKDKGKRILIRLAGMRLEDFRFSPDSKKIAFFAIPAKKNRSEGLQDSATGIYTVDLTGEDLHHVVPGGFRPTWKPMVDQ